MIFILVLASLSGFCTAVVWGPAEVRVLDQDSTTVQCGYADYEHINNKYWCKENFVGYCRTLAQTDGPNTYDRVSITDDKTSRSFSVAMENLREGDSGWYRCGISVSGILLNGNEENLVYISIKKVQGPERVTGMVKETLTVRCKYHRSYAKNIKYWCRKTYYLPCSTVVRTESPHTHSRFSIRDNQTEGAFYVTMTDLTKEDEGSYQCGISKPGFNFDETSSVYVHIKKDATILDLQGPLNVIGQVSTNEIVRCQYAEAYTDSVKYWCKEDKDGQCKPLVDTESKQTHDRTQIRDDPSNREFRITIRNLTEQDTGRYQCGAKHSSHSVKWVQIYLYVESVTSTTSKESLSTPTVTTRQIPYVTQPTTRQNLSGLDTFRTLGVLAGVLLTLLCGLAIIIICKTKPPRRSHGTHLHHSGDAQPQTAAGPEGQQSLCQCKCPPVSTAASTRRPRSVLHR
ncbi:polymeric immunoglobulin receptor-like isoform X2 [Megalops cyprinoides]|uniref:polymeric immunoglobulin receptor-like isoform X2 n=1 Tax=Megalops cyprinoides TaxID=118141 RepID=UPI001864C6EB|nr:polymeric immunoglobulin receptor-like isoform X2 [Megalops cyprinoides]